VFLDPPFAQQLWTPLAQRLEQGGWLADAAQIYVESPRGLALALPSNWQPYREGHAGEVRYALYRRFKDAPIHSA
jgi:16S rRNA (guanine966-N2)-methyltransferase